MGSNFSQRKRLGEVMQQPLGHYHGWSLEITCPSGIPQLLAWLEDVIFEGLPNRMAKTWPERFLSSISPGKDLSHVAWQFLYWLLTEGGFEERDHPTVKAAVRQCADVLVPLAHGRPWGASRRLQPGANSPGHTFTRIARAWQRKSRLFSLLFIFDTQVGIQ